MEIRNVFKKKKIWLFLISCSVIYRSTSALAMARYTKYVFDSISRNEVYISKICLFGFVVVIWGASSLAIQNLAIDLFTNKIVNETRIIFMKSLMKHPIRKLSDIGEGRLLSNYTKDIDSIGDFIRNTIDIIRIPFEMIIASLYLIYTNWFFGIIVIILLPPVTVIGNYIGKNMAKITHKYMQKNDELLIIVNRVLKGIDVIKANSIENIIEKDFTEFSVDKYYLENKQTKYNSMFSGLIDLFMGLPFIIIFILSSIFFSIQTLTVGTIMMFLQLLNKITVPFIRFNQIMLQYKQTKISLDRLNEVINIKNEDINNKLNFEEEVNSIIFKNVYFKYKDKYIFDDFSLNIEPGKYYGIVGENGSGKSTFVKLLLGLYTPDSGDIFLNEYKYDSLSLDYIRDSKKIVYVENEPCILFDHLDRNITLDNLNNEEKLKEILNNIGLLDVYNELLRKNADEVSSGQKQRIALARGLYNLKKNTIFVLDEPFSALDSNIINKLQKTILEYKSKNNLTILEITHNLNNMERFDTIYYFEDGKIIMNGKHEELLNNQKYRQYISNFKKNVV